MTINVTEKIRKMMGWCLNADALTRRKSVQFDDIMVNAPGSGGEHTQMTVEWWNKQRNRILIGIVGGTLLAVIWFISYGINNMNVFLAGIFTGIAVNVMSWSQGLNSLNRIASSETPVKTSTKQMLVVCILIIMGTIAIGYSAYFYGLGAVYAYISGFAFTSWGGYLQIAYWEKKNRKTIVAHGFYKPTVTAINSEV
jgi:hypothetical protein